MSSKWDLDSTLTYLENFSAQSPLPASFNETLLSLVTMDNDPEDCHYDISPNTMFEREALDILTAQWKAADASKRVRDGHNRLRQARTQLQGTPWHQRRVRRDLTEEIAGLVGSRIAVAKADERHRQDEAAQMPTSVRVASLSVLALSTKAAHVIDGEAHIEFSEPPYVDPDLVEHQTDLLRSRRIGVSWTVHDAKTLPVSTLVELTRSRPGGGYVARFRSRDVSLPSSKWARRLLHPHETGQVAVAN